MKKLRLSNIFHWLYAILMFLPFILLFGYIIVFAFNPSVVVSEEGLRFDLLTDLYNFVPSFFFGDGILSDVEDTIEGVFINIIGDDGDPTILYPTIRNLFVYWVEVSISWLVFDLAMFPINLCHRWIDKGGLE